MKAARSRGGSATTPPKKPKPGRDASFLGPGPRWKRAVYWTAVIGLWGLLALGGAVTYVVWDLPDVDEAIAATRKPTVRLVTLDGREIARRGDRYGQAVLVEHLPPALPHAILSTEDRRFYSHFGIDPIGIARAMWTNIRAGGIRQGGSTLTQQAAKNLFLTPDRTIKRKLQELALALWLEAKFTKDEIFTIYLNRVYFGRGVYGVDAAARYYFDVSPRNLSIYQSAMLAGMLKGPNSYNPFSNLERAKKRAAQVLDNMVAAGHLGDEDAKRALRDAARVRGERTDGGPMAQHFADWAFAQVPDFVTIDRDLTVFVTIDPAKQRAAERAVERMMKPGGTADKRGASEAALVALAPDGAVVALVGGRDYGESQYNRVVQAKRQPGSAFKPMVYLAGLDAGLTPETKLTDEPVDVDGWRPSNFKNEFLGPITLTEAMARSVNTVAVKVAERAGRGRVQAVARKLGVTSDLTAAPSLALGVSEMTLLELTAAYGAFATGGDGVWPYAITEIQDAAGKPLYVRSGGGPGRVIPAGHAGAINAMLSAVIDHPDGTGRAAKLDRPAAGKTGTSQDHRDALFVGYTPDLIAGVWMGNDNGTPMKGVTGGSFPARLWKDFMTAALAGRPAR
ncbi:MAG: PBP1A family penicillin-binding protein, partial [Alphaproteobacteria bacterium]|nr:PBP1A family penicillin-binding protein [Alphaproteobacteria bacterium]